VTATCRSCGAAIRWATTASGKRMPLDRDPVDDGNLALIIDVGLDVVAVPVAPRQALLDDDGRRFVSHYATCPDAEQWRRS
jgi:hypothetical protein